MLWHKSFLYIERCFWGERYYIKNKAYIAIDSKSQNLMMGLIERME